MKGLKKFMEDLVKDKNLAEKFKDVADPEEVAKLAEKEGYHFSAREYEELAMKAVSGGISDPNINTMLRPTVVTPQQEWESFLRKNGNGILPEQEN